MQYLISGEVIKGDGYGRQLGFPTVNLKVRTEALPPAGVYAGAASFVSKGIFDTYRAGILINPGGKVEAHLIGYNGDAYGKIVTLKLKKFLREYKNFDTEEELINQIKEDIKRC